MVSDMDGRCELDFPIGAGRTELMRYSILLGDKAGETEMRTQLRGYAWSVVPDAICGKDENRAMTSHDHVCRHGCEFLRH